MQGRRVDQLGRKWSLLVSRKRTEPWTLLENSPPIGLQHVYHLMKLHLFWNRREKPPMQLSFPTRRMISCREVANFKSDSIPVPSPRSTGAAGCSLINQQPMMEPISHNSLSLSFYTKQDLYYHYYMNVVVQHLNNLYQDDSIW